MKRIVLFIFCGFFALTITAKSVTPAASLPAYYEKIDGKSGKALFDAVQTVTKTGYSSLGYDGLWTAFKTTDKKSNGQVWDMYSDCNWTFGSDQCGSYSNECDCYNREHSIPKSWFGGSTSGPGCDIFHLVPTDGKVNGMRSNYSFGEVSSANYTYDGAKKGTAKSITITGGNTIAGNTGATISASGTVFEPRDEYKGDFARGYMGALLKWAGDKAFTSGEGAKTFTTNYSTGSFGLTKYGVALLMKWHRQDPVSQKEIDRNNGIQQTQGNRNPFIDYPYLAEYIWGEKAGEILYLDDMMTAYDVDFVLGESDGSREDVVHTPQLSVSATQVNFPSILVDEESAYSIKVSGMYLTSNITLTISGEDADMFETSRSSLTISEANSSNTQNNVILTYVPTEQGQHSGTLQITSEGAEPVIVKLYGVCNKLCHVTWMVNGEEYTAGEPTTTLAAGGKVNTLPTAPKSPCAESNQFVGWSEEVITTAQDDIPTDLFSDASEAPIISHDVVYNAVFATLEETEILATPAAPVTMDLNDTEGWTLSGLIRDTKHWRMVTDSYIESPSINIASIISITINMRTYGGASYNTIEFSADGNNIGELKASTNKLANYTWTPATTLSGSGVLRFSSKTNTNQNGPALSSIHIEMAGGGVITEYYYSNYVTYCGPTTDIVEVQQPKLMANKILSGGQLLIEYNGVYYNTLGQVVKL
ncbi:MAG: endonuclease [Paludibacteraceae bacterium]|nr:endonuclease [Paludibacteraceae bacterium]